MKKALQRAFPLTLPVMAGYLFLGVTFGLLCKSEGYATWVPVAMSVIIYSGALEFAAVPLLCSVFDPLSAFVLGVTLSARHLFYGIPLLKKYAQAKAEKPFLMFGLTDETFSILSTAEVPEDCSPRAFFFWVTLLNYAYWTGGTLLGALLGAALSFNLEGLDFALTALFVVLFLEQMRTGSGRKSGAAGLILALLALLLVGKTYFILVSMALILTALLAGRRFFCHD